VPSGDSPDGMGATVRANRDGLSPRLLSSVPVGGSPTGAGEPPALPMLRAISDGDDFERRAIRQLTN